MCAYIIKHVLFWATFVSLFSVRLFEQWGYLNRNKMIPLLGKQESFGILSQDANWQPPSPFSMTLKAPNLR